MSYLAIIILLLNLHGSDMTNEHYINSSDSLSAKTPHHKMSISEVLKKYTDTWMEIPGVLGTGEGKSEGKPCIVIFTDRNSKEIKKKIPKNVDGYKVVFEETGEIKAR